MAGGLVTDLEDDGRAEVLVTLRSMHTSIVRRADDGTYAVTPTTLAPSGLARADLDADGTVDLVTLGSSVGLLRMVAGRLEVTPWLRAETLAEGITVDGIAAADFDGNGEVDIAMLARAEYGATPTLLVIPDTRVPLSAALPQGPRVELPPAVRARPVP